MKRVLSLVLAVIMTMSLASVAFAAVSEGYGDDILNITDDLYRYDSDKGYLVRWNDSYEPGETVYIRLVDDNLSNSQVNKYRVYADWQTGSSYINTNNMTIVYRKAELGSNTWDITATISGFATNPTSITFNTPLNPSNSNDLLAIKKQALNNFKANNATLYNAKKNDYKAESTHGIYTVGANKYVVKTPTEAVSRAQLNTQKVYKVDSDYYLTDKAMIEGKNPGYTYAANVYLNPNNSAKAFTSAIAALKDAYPGGVDAPANSLYQDSLDAFYDLDTAFVSAKSSMSLSDVTTPVYVVDPVTNEFSTDPLSGGIEQTTGYIGNVGGTDTWFADKKAVLDHATSGYTAAQNGVGLLVGTSFYPSANVSSVSGYINGNAYLSEAAALSNVGTYTEPSVYVYNSNYYDPTNSTEMTALFGLLTTSVGNSVVYYDDTTRLVISDIEAHIDNIAINAMGISNRPSTSSTSYSYFASIPTKSSSTTRILDAVGKIGVATSQSKFKNQKGANVIIEIAYTKVSDNSGSITVGSDEAVVKFEKDAGEVDIEFGNNGELALFIVNASGQSDVNLKYSTAFNADFANEHSYANLDFLTWVHTPMFNRTGTLYIYADRDTYLYEITSDGFKEVDATYDRSYDAWKLTTRKLGSYVISDRKLTATSSSSSSSSSSSNGSSNGGTGSSGGTTSGGSSGNGGNKYNPNTGRCA